MPWDGRDRLDLSGYPKVDVAVRVLGSCVEMRTPAVTVEVRTTRWFLRVLARVQSMSSNL